MVSIDTIVQWLVLFDRSFISQRIEQEIAMATVLVQSACGRILLHIVAMLGDREVRWHCAGIAREVFH
jgi:hypothetical protein